MEYTTLGETGSSVSPICLGCMSFAEDPDRWGTDREESAKTVDRAIDLGIDLFDTANVSTVASSI